MTIDDAVLTDEVLGLFRDDGFSVRKISRILKARGVSAPEDAVLRILARAGLWITDAGDPERGTRRHRKYAEIPNLHELARQWSSGKSLYVLERETGFGSNTLRKHFEDAGYSAPSPTGSQS